MNKSKNSIPQHYETEKLTFAAFLVATQKAELVGTKPLGRGKGVIFVLSKAPSSEEVTAFFNGSAQVSALRFSETINMLKSAAYEGLKCSGSTN